MNERPGGRLPRGYKTFVKFFWVFRRLLGRGVSINTLPGTVRIKHEEYTCNRFSMTTPKCLRAWFCPIPDFLSLLLHYHLFWRFNLLVCATTHQRSAVFERCDTLPQAVDCIPPSSQPERR